MTVEEQAAQHRAAYRAKCTHQRVGKSIIDLSSNEKKDYPSINAAKRAVRSNNLTVFV